MGRKDVNSKTRRKRRAKKQEAYIKYLEGELRRYQGTMCSMDVSSFESAWLHQCPPELTPDEQDAFVLAVKSALERGDEYVTFESHQTAWTLKL